MKSLNTSTEAYKKSDAYNAVLEAWRTDGQLENFQLEALLKYFAPNKPAKPKDAFAWVASATADKKEVRYYLAFVYCDGKRIIGTDGHRLHIADNTEELAQGFYCPVTRLPVDCDAKYPDIDRVIPSGKAYTTLPVSEFEQGIISHDYKGKKVNTPVYKHTDAQGEVKAQLNKAYVDKAASIGRVSVFAYGSGCTISGEAEHGKFVVMGMRP